MVLINDKKFACATCIKGHRSSTCAHTNRPLFAIRAKGRPVSQCDHCRELRKTKQVHVKCQCVGGSSTDPHVGDEPADPSSSKKGGRKTKTLEPSEAVFPNGITDVIEAAALLSQISESGLASPTIEDSPPHSHSPSQPCPCDGLATTEVCGCCTPKHTPRNSKTEKPSRPTVKRSPSLIPDLSAPASPSPTIPQSTRSSSNASSRNGSSANLPSLSALSVSGSSTPFPSILHEPQHHASDGHQIGGHQNDHHSRHLALFSPYSHSAAEHGHHGLSHRPASAYLLHGPSQLHDSHGPTSQLSGSLSDQPTSISLNFSRSDTHLPSSGTPDPHPISRFPAQMDVDHSHSPFSIDYTHSVNSNNPPPAYFGSLGKLLGSADRETGQGSAGNVPRPPISGRGGQSISTPDLLEFLRSNNLGSASSSLGTSPYPPSTPFLTTPQSSSPSRTSFVQHAAPQYSPIIAEGSVFEASSLQQEFQSTASSEDGSQDAITTSLLDLGGDGVQHLQNSTGRNQAPSLSPIEEDSPGTFDMSLALPDAQPPSNQQDTDVFSAQRQLQQYVQASMLSSFETNTTSPASNCPAGTGCHCWNSVAGQPSARCGNPSCPCCQGYGHPDNSSTSPTADTVSPLHSSTSSPPSQTGVLSSRNNNSIDYSAIFESLGLGTSNSKSMGNLEAVTTEPTRVGRQAHRGLLNGASSGRGFSLSASRGHRSLSRDTELRSQVLERNANTAEMNGSGATGDSNVPSLSSIGRYAFGFYSTSSLPSSFSVVEGDSPFVKAVSTPDPVLPESRLNRSTSATSLRNTDYINSTNPFRRSVDGAFGVRSDPYGAPLTQIKLEESLFDQPDLSNPASLLQPPTWPSDLSSITQPTTGGFPFTLPDAPTPIQDGIKTQQPGFNFPPANFLT